MDLSGDPNFTDEDFNDTDHLNDFGELEIRMRLNQFEAFKKCPNYKL